MKKILIGVGVVAIGAAAVVGYVSYKKLMARKAFADAISEAIKNKEPMSVDDLCAEFDTDFEEDLPVEDFFAEAEKEEGKEDKAP